MLGSSGVVGRPTISGTTRPSEYTLYLNPSKTTDFGSPVLAFTTPPPAIRVGCFGIIAAIPVFSAILVFGAIDCAICATPPIGIPAAATASSATVGVLAALAASFLCRITFLRFNSLTTDIGRMLPDGLCISLTSC